MKKKLAAARRRIENGDGAKEGEEEVEVEQKIKHYMHHAYCFLTTPRHVIRSAFWTP
jgi:hypothetical protein